MYAFPRVRLPPKAVEEAARQGRKPDFLYCLELLNQTGITCVPGSGFEQQDGTFHFRTTVLPPEEQIGEVIRRLSEFHEGFMKQYG